MPRSVELIFLEGIELFKISMKNINLVFQSPIVIIFKNLFPYF